MATSNPSPDEKNLWEDFRETIRGGMRDLRTVGDELARQGRLRMDIYQIERRLKTAYEDLGRATHVRFTQEMTLSTQDTTLTELNVRVVYYERELERLHDELQQSTGSMN
ncbi:MAG TPA: hypothetical protein VGL38_01620 [bacterium]|jgi:hypothetical protein